MCYGNTHEEHLPGACEFKEELIEERAFKYNPEGYIEVSLEPEEFGIKEKENTNN